MLDAACRPFAAQADLPAVQDLRSPGVSIERAPAATVAMMAEGPARCSVLSESGLWLLRRLHRWTWRLALAQRLREAREEDLEIALVDAVGRPEAGLEDGGPETAGEDLPADPFRAHADLTGDLLC